MKRILPEPNLRLIPSVVANGKRFRVLSNEIYLEPVSETFHEFLAKLVKWTFGKDWWLQQAAMPLELRHVVLQWMMAFARNSRRQPLEVETSEFGTSFATVGSGPTKALMTFGYDLYCLRAKNRLLGSMIDRLRERQSFQSARYEIAVANILSRAGFNIQLLDEQRLATKHCEFIATAQNGNFHFGVEAKSRVRPGVLHRQGDFAYTEDSKGLRNLIRTASKQGVADMPFVIFLDVNLPPTSNLNIDSGWARDVNRIADDMDRRATQPGGKASPYSLLVATNFAYHFGGDEGVAAPLELCAIRPLRASIELPIEVTNEITRATMHYGHVPDDV
jgi:hypothetical protein